MKLKKFEQPLFDAADYNGFGRKVRTSFNPTGGPVPKFNEVKNNSGVEDANGLKVKLKHAKNFSSLDNFGIPFMNESSLMVGSDIFNSDRTDISSSTNSAFTKRLIPTDKKIESLAQHINSSKYDLLTVDVWTDNFIRGASMGYQASGAIGYFDGTTYTDKILSKIIDGKKSKMALANVPNVLDFPYFKIMTNELLIRGLSGQKYIYYKGGSQPKLITQSDYNHLPTSTFDSLASTKVHISLKKGLTENNPINGDGQILSTLTIQANKSNINDYNSILGCGFDGLTEFTIVAQENTGTSTRYGTITITGSNGEIETIPVEQSATTGCQDTPLTNLSPTNPSGEWQGYGTMRNNLNVSGQTLMVGGYQTNNGIGTHANNRLVYNLNGQYSTFSGSVGRDDAADNCGCGTMKLQFIIKADGATLFTSNLLGTADGKQAFSVNVVGKNNIELIVNDGGDQSWGDHADWLDAILYLRYATHLHNRTASAN
jgi:hypothetical protein